MVLANYTIEDFDNGLDKYTVTNTVAGDYEITTADARTGANALRYSSQADGWKHILTSSTHTPAPKRGYPFSWSQKFDADKGRGKFVFFTQADAWLTDAYSLSMWLGSGTNGSTLRLQKCTNGSFGTLAETTFTHTTTEWTDFYVDPQDPTISVTVQSESGTQLATLSADDAVSTGGYASGGYGFDWDDQTANASTPLFDSVTTDEVQGGIVHLRKNGVDTPHMAYINDNGVARECDVLLNQNGTPTRLG